MHLIAGTKVLDGSKKKAKNLYNSDGLELIRAEYAAVSLYLDDKACNLIEFACDGFVSLGLEEMTQMCFAELRGEYEGWMKVQVPQRRISDALVAGKYIAMMQRHLSEAELVRFDALIDKKSAHGNLELTCQCINATLSRFTSESMLARLQSGKAFQAAGQLRDTRKPGERMNVNERIEAGESPPGPCPYPGCTATGNAKLHWLKLCPSKLADEKKAAAAKIKKAAKQKAKQKSQKAKKAVAANESDSDESEPPVPAGKANMLSQLDVAAAPILNDPDLLFAGAAGERRTIILHGSHDCNHCGSGKKGQMMIAADSADSPSDLRLDLPNDAHDTARISQLLLAKSVLPDAPPTFLSYLIDLGCCVATVSGLLNSFADPLLDSDPAGLAQCIADVERAAPSRGLELIGEYCRAVAPFGCVHTGRESHPLLSQAMRALLPFSRSRNPDSPADIDIVQHPLLFEACCTVLSGALSHLEQVGDVGKPSSISTMTLADAIITHFHVKCSPDFTDSALASASSTARSLTYALVEQSVQSVRSPDESGVEDDADFDDNSSVSTTTSNLSATAPPEPVSQRLAQISSPSPQPSRWPDHHPFSERGPLERWRFIFLSSAKCAEPPR